MTARVYELRGMFSRCFIVVRRCADREGWEIIVVARDVACVHDPAHIANLYARQLSQTLEEPSVGEVRRAFKKFVNHEAAEAFWVDGKQLHNPHEGESMTARQK
jgi:hypothetical protein